MNDGLSVDIQKKFMLPLTSELHDPKEKVFHNAPVSPRLGRTTWKYEFSGCSKSYLSNKNLWQTFVLEDLTEDKILARAFGGKNIGYCHVIQNRLWRHNLPRKLASKLRCIRGSRRENRGKQRWSSVFRNVTFLKNTTAFSFPPFPYFRVSNLGKINANFSGEIVTSSTVLDHRVDLSGVVSIT